MNDHAHRYDRQRQVSQKHKSKERQTMFADMNKKQLSVYKSKFHSQILHQGKHERSLEERKHEKLRDKA